MPLTALARGRNGHSVFAPSASAMWIGCPGSLIPNLLEPDDAGYEAAEGTVAHEVAETWLRTGRKPEHLVGTVREIVNGENTFSVEITDTMLDYVEEYFDWCSALPGHHYVEVRVDISPLTPIPNQTGTSDHIAVEPGRLTVTDLKYGTGVLVSAAANTQALLYGYGAFLEYDEWYEFEEIVLRICQPRLGNFDTYTLSRKELLEFGEYVKKQARIAWQLNAPRRPSEKACKWCRVKHSCAALAALAEDVLSGAYVEEEQGFMDEDLTALKDRIDKGMLYLGGRPLAELTVNQMAEIQQFSSLIGGWLKAVEAHLTAAAVKGETVPGHKVVNGRSKRVFTDEKAAARKLADLGIDKDVMYETQLISPSKAEELLKKEGWKQKELPALLAGLVSHPPGNPKLVPDTDRRHALREDAGSAFSDTTA